MHGLGLHLSEPQLPYFLKEHTHLGLGSASQEEIHLIASHGQAFTVKTVASQGAKGGCRLRKETLCPARKPNVDRLSLGIKLGQ